MPAKSVVAPVKAVRPAPEPPPEYETVEPASLVSFHVGPQASNKFLINVDPEPVIVTPAACDTPTPALVKARAATNPVAIFLLSFISYFSLVVC